MDPKFRKEVYKLVARLLLMFQLASASTSAPEITCTPNRHADGTVTYELTPHPWTSRCADGWTNWVSEDGTNLAHGLKADPTAVVNVTKNSIKLKRCESRLQFRWQCGQVREETNCSVNCSLLVGPALQPVVCFSKTSCMAQRDLGLIIGIPACFLLVAVFGGLCFWKFISQRRRRSAAQATMYSSVNNEVKMEEGLVDQQD